MSSDASLVLLHLYKKCQVKSRLFQFLTHGASHIASFSKYAADFLIYARAGTFTYFLRKGFFDYVPITVKKTSRHLTLC